MKSWEILQIAIPRKSTERAAQLLNVSADYVRRWRREPTSDEAPLATGQRSILDRICDLLDVVFLVNPQGVGFIVEYINGHYQQLIKTHAPALPDHKCCARESADLLKEATEAVNSLNLSGATIETLRELIELRDRADNAIASVTTTLKIDEVQ